VDATTTGLAVALVAATTAALLDLRARRIPNWLTVTAFGGGLALNAWASGPNGLLWSLGGAGLGLLLLLPFYAVRGVGAGDVKLLAAMGAVLGLTTLLWVALFTALIGGAMSLALVVARRRIGLMAAQVKSLQPPATGLKAPYGLAIAGGVYLAVVRGVIG
jgi:prepilin peptidase CpaA